MVLRLLLLLGLTCLVNCWRGDVIYEIPLSFSWKGNPVQFLHMEKNGKGSKTNGFIAPYIFLMCNSARYNPHNGASLPDIWFATDVTYDDAYGQTYESHPLDDESRIDEVRGIYIFTAWCIGARHRGIKHPDPKFKADSMTFGGKEFSLSKYEWGLDKDILYFKSTTKKASPAKRRSSKRISSTKSCRKTNNDCSSSEGASLSPAAGAFDPAAESETAAEEHKIYEIPLEFFYKGKLVQFLDVENLVIGDIKESHIFLKCYSHNYTPNRSADGILLPREEQPLPDIWFRFKRDYLFGRTCESHPLDDEAQIGEVKQISIDLHHCCGESKTQPKLIADSMSLGGKMFKISKSKMPIDILKMNVLRSWLRFTETTKKAPSAAVGDTAAGGGIAVKGGDTAAERDSRSVTRKRSSPTSHPYGANIGHSRIRAEAPQLFRQVSQTTPAS